MKLFGRRWVGLLVVAAAIGGVGWIFLQARQARRQADPASARQNGKPIPVRTALASEGPVEIVVGATAVTAPSETANIRIGPSRDLSSNSPACDINVKAVHVREGDRVTKGQLLAEIDDEVLGQILRQREAALAAAEADLKLLKEQVPISQSIRDLALGIAEADLEMRNTEASHRSSSLEAVRKLQASRSVSHLEFIDTHDKAAITRSEARLADLQLQKMRKEQRVGQLSDQRDLARALHAFEVARINLESIRNDVKRCSVKSPIAGFVSQELVTPGTTVGVNALIVQVIQLDPLWLRLDLPQERLSEVSVGQTAEIALDSFPQETFRGTVIAVPPRVTTELRIAPVIVEMRNPESRVKAGLSGYVRLRMTRRAVTVPALAVLQQGGRPAVFRVENGRARLRPVRLGPLVEVGVQEIRGGLEAGDEVVIYQSNFYKHYGELTKTEAFLQDEDLVDADWKRWARRD
jgi:RND family efflux transporter MFP subunit